jgi:type IV pilus assembly protein PilF
LIRVAVIAAALALFSGCSTPAVDAANTKSARIHTELAGMYFERSQFAVALEELAIALRADPDYAPAYSVRGLVHMALREDDLAEDDFRKSLRIDKSDSDTQNNFGWYLCQRGREKESIPHFMAAIKDPLYQTPQRAFLNAGLCSRKIGASREAEDYLQRALTAQPNMPQALYALADMRFSEGDVSGAKRYLSGLAQNRDTLTAEQLWLAFRIERKTGDRNEAASYALQLRKRFPDAPETQSLMRGE